MTDEKWEQFKDSRWTTTAQNDPVIQHHEKQKQKYEHYWDQQFDEFNKRQKRQREQEESKVEADDYFETTYVQNQHKKSNPKKSPKRYIPENDDAFEQAMDEATRKAEKEHRNRHKKPIKIPGWIPRLKKATKVATMIDKTLKTVLPEPNIEGVPRGWDNPPMPNPTANVPSEWDPTDFNIGPKYHDFGQWIKDNLQKKPDKKDPNPPKDPPGPGPTNNQSK